ncbi:MAG: UDP-N-acetylmuramoyl-L-alanine--D-glutamate ligase [Chlorobiaceae bacterium]|nr:UDP-N-acetylmuramoyl-L-alanine--D-glutamate ligase [Chlorobiaceae bacterium]
MDLSGEKVSVIGAGKSGIAAAELLSSAGADVLLSDIGRIEEHEVLRLQKKRISVEHDGHSERVYDADFCVISPGIPPHAQVVKTLESKGIHIISEIELASLFCKARIVGITGTDGKTTTSTLIHRICEADALQHGYRSFSVGNIGVPFSSKVQDMKPEDVAVVELSSYQLERCFFFKPDVAVITNITPDHLSRYDGVMPQYAAAKFRIYANQGAGDTLIYNEDDPLLSEHFAEKHFPFKIVPFGMESVPEGCHDRRIAVADGERIVVRTVNGEEQVILISEFLKDSFRGRHNISNVLAAIAAARALGIGYEVVRSVLKEFKGVEHRQEFVMTLNGACWVNDSKATNINAMRQALEAVPGTCVLIAGGRDKGNDYTSIAGLVGKKVSLLVAMGESKTKITTAFEGIVPVHEALSLEDAVSFAYGAAGEGQTVLFSPGCASFDMFENYEDRGIKFKQCVYHLQPC